MKTGALVLGIIGGLVTLVYGLFGFGLGSLADMGDQGSGTFVKLLSVILPIAAIIGAGMVRSKAVMGAGLMGVTAVAFVIMFGFNFFTFIPVALLGVAAFLGVAGAREA